jgi:hypothetical protein
MLFNKICWRAERRAESHLNGLNVNSAAGFWGIIANRLTI